MDNTLSAAYIRLKMLQQFTWIEGGSFSKCVPPSPHPLLGQGECLWQRPQARRALKAARDQRSRPLLRRPQVRKPLLRRFQPLSLSASQSLALYTNIRLSVPRANVGSKTCRPHESQECPHPRSHTYLLRKPQERPHQEREPEERPPQERSPQEREPQE